MAFLKMVKRKFSVDEQLYSRIPIQNLILFGIFSLIKRGEKCTFDALIKECFNLFPKAFCFSKNPKWPDSRKLDRPLRTLRKIKLISGNPKTVFTLTKKGRQIALEIARNFHQKKLL